MNSQRTYRRKPIFRSGTLIALLLGAVLGPAVVTAAVGILLLVFAEAGRDVLFGVLVVVFTVAVVVGVIIAAVFAGKTGRLAELQSRFVANVSHELRTPLTSIRLLVESLHSGRVEDPKQVRRCLEVLTTETERLDGLIEQILDWRPMDRDTPQLCRRPESVALLVEEAVRTFLPPPTGEEEGEDSLVEIHVARGLPPVEVDREAILMAIRNLIHNSLKFGGERPLRVTGRGTDDGIAISVEDDGPGIEQKELERVFERFYRVDRSGEEDPGGTGLGLAITRQVVEAHDGRVTAESELGRGSVFTIQLPVRRSDGK